MPHSERKTRKRRGHRTAGWGRVGQHRKSGMRGGFGKAGLDRHKASYMQKYLPDYFGKHGFKSLRARPRAINIGDLEPLMKKIEGGSPQGIVSLDLGEEGFEKLLGRGIIREPVKVKVKKASPRAVEKVEAAGGEVIIGTGS